jgi:hypothetical protein
MRFTGTARDEEKPTICYQTWAFRYLKISMDYQVVPEAGLEPAQAFTRGILSLIGRVLGASKPAWLTHSCCTV